MHPFKRIKRRRYRAIIIAAIAACIIGSILSISNKLTEPYAHIKPGYPEIDITGILSKENLTEDDYKTLLYQTGLGKPAIDDFKKDYSDFKERILAIQKYFFSDVKYICEKNSPISREEYVVDENGQLKDATVMAPLHNGYILLTNSSHTYGWRNGHAALVVDASNGKTLESVVLGTNSCVQDISKWLKYPNFLLLRLKNASPQLLDKVAQSALKNLNDIPYSLTVGIFSPKFEKPGKIAGTQCSHLVWDAFRLYGYDLDSDGGPIVTPKDIAKSPLLEIVQVYGVNPKNIWP